MATVSSDGEVAASAVAPVFGGYKVDFLRQLGHGAFGTVYQAWDSNNGLVAIKKISRDEGRKAIEEAVKLQKLKVNLGWHKHIITIYDVKYWMGAIWIVMEKCDHGDLEKYFKKNCNSLDTVAKVQFMKHVMNGLAYLHSQNVVHRDIKPANILVKSTTMGAGINIKLADFGLCRILTADESTMSSNVGTLMFKAPEFWDPKSNDKVRYHRNVDVYAAGLTFAAMLQAVPGRNKHLNNVGGGGNFSSNSVLLYFIYGQKSCKQNLLNSKI